MWIATLGKTKQKKTKKDVLFCEQWNMLEKVSTAWNVKEKVTSQKWLLTKDHFLVNLMGTKSSCRELSRTRTCSNSMGNSSIIMEIDSYGNGKLLNSFNGIV